MEALITLGQHPSPHVAFSMVKVPVQHGPPAGATYQAPYLLSAVPSGQATPASSPDGTLATSTTTAFGMTSPLENLYPDVETTDSIEPVFSQPSPVSYGDSVSHSLLASASSSCYTGTD